MSDKKPSERQRDEATVALLKKLREKLLSDHISTARVAAYRLSWLQEDGLAILKEALFGKYPRTAKKASAYGLRNMKGRMKKMAAEVLEQGLNHSDRTTQAACLKSLQLMRGEVVPNGKAQNKPRSSRRRIRSTSHNRDRDNQKSFHEKKSSSSH
ncbi:MAG: hypothetical protein ISS71_02530 [Phycisphaerae bacterium]|nr:hypothetical protein [Phycisphaerae bacterium]